jgi:hypothetical protein
MHKLVALHSGRGGTAATLRIRATTPDSDDRDRARVLAFVGSDFPKKV